MKPNSDSRTHVECRIPKKIYEAGEKKKTFLQHKNTHVYYFLNGVYASMDFDLV